MHQPESLQHMDHEVHPFPSAPYYAQCESLQGYKDFKSLSHPRVIQHRNLQIVLGTYLISIFYLQGLDRFGKDILAARIPFAGEGAQQPPQRAAPPLAIVLASASPRDTIGTSTREGAVRCPQPSLPEIPLYNSCRERFPSRPFAKKAGWGRWHLETKGRRIIHYECLCIGIGLVKHVPRAPLLRSREMSSSAGAGTRSAPQHASAAGSDDATRSELLQRRGAGSKQALKEPRRGEPLLQMI